MVSFGKLLSSAKKAASFVAKHKLASRGLNLVGMQKAAGVAKTLGAGRVVRRRRAATRMPGGRGLFGKIVKSIIKPAVKFAVKNKLGSKYLPGKAGQVAGALGAGRVVRRRRAVGGRKMYASMPGGASIFTKLYRKVLKPTAKFIKKNKIISTFTPGLVGKAAGMVGLGRRRRRATTGARRRVYGMGVRQVARRRVLMA